MIWEIALICAIAIGVGAGVAYINHEIIFARMKRRWAKEDEQWAREDESSDLKLDGMGGDE